MPMDVVMFCNEQRLRARTIQFLESFLLSWSLGVNEKKNSNNRLSINSHEKQET
jgi:hypothetical protein